MGVFQLLYSTYPSAFPKVVLPSYLTLELLIHGIIGPQTFFLGFFVALTSSSSAEHLFEFIYQVPLLL
jgi:hypothetical protein